MKKIVWFLLFAFVSNICFADTFLMTDGSTLVGKVVFNGGSFLKVQDKQGKIIKINVEDNNLYSWTIDVDQQKASLSSTDEHVVTEQELKQQQYLSYFAIQNISKQTEGVKTIMAWEFGISIACVAVGIIELFVASKSSGH